MPGPHGTQPLVAGHRRRDSNTYGVKHRSTTREASPRRHCLNTPRPACRTTSTVRFSPFTPLSVAPPSPSTRHVLRSPPTLPHIFQRLRNNLREGDGVATSHTSRQTDNVASSSDVSRKNEATRAVGQWNSSRVVENSLCSANNSLVQCKSTIELLTM
jgi:hypothetical protein